MGDPKQQKKKFSTPSHPWQKERIEEEKRLKFAYGLKNKHEIWKMSSLLQNFKETAKQLIAARTNQADLERKQLIARLQKYGLLDATASNIAAVLSINVDQIMERRLQTLVFKKRLARSLKQARQMITHEHIMVGTKKINVPSYLVTKEQENQLSYAAGSGYVAEDHPERPIIAAPLKERVVREKQDERGRRGPPRRRQERRD